MKSYIQKQCCEIAKNKNITASMVVRILAEMGVYPDGTDLGHLGKLEKNPYMCKKFAPIKTNRFIR